MVEFTSSLMPVSMGSLQPVYVKHQVLNYFYPSMSGEYDICSCVLQYLWMNLL